jgi:peptidyl-prolyl cis-trans isomerase C
MSEVVVRVNGTEIKRADLENAVQGYAIEQLRKTLDQLSEEELAELREMAMEKLLARELIYQEALLYGIVATEEAIDEEKFKIIANFPSEDEFYATLEKAGIDAMTYHRMLRQDISVNLMTDKKIADLPDPSEEEVVTMYEKHPEKMVRRGRVRASHILAKLREGSEEQALLQIRELQKQVTPENFAEQALQHSDCPSKTAGGDLGWFRRGDMVKQFEDVAFAMQPGDISDVVATQFGFHLIKLVDREEDVKLTCEEARPMIVKFIKEESSSRMLKEWVEELKERADIEFFDN